MLINKNHAFLTSITGMICKRNGVGFCEVLASILWHNVCQKNAETLTAKNNFHFELEKI